MFSVPGIMSSVGNPEMNKAHALSSSLSTFPLISLIKRLKLSLLHCRGPLGPWTPAGSRVLKLVGQKESENAPDHPVTC